MYNERVWVWVWRGCETAGCAVLSLTTWDSSASKCVARTILAGQSVRGLSRVNTLSKGAAHASRCVRNGALGANILRRVAGMEEWQKAPPAPAAGS